MSKTKKGRAKIAPKKAVKKGAKAKKATPVKKVKSKAGLISRLFGSKKSTPPTSKKKAKPSVKKARAKAPEVTKKAKLTTAKRPIVKQTKPKEAPAIQKASAIKIPEVIYNPEPFQPSSIQIKKGKILTAEGWKRLFGT